MAQFTITFAEDLNSSVQVGDIAYYATVTANSGFQTSSTSHEIGTIISVDRVNKQIVVSSTLPNNTFTTADYIFFKKSDKVNFGRLLGYYAETKFKNDSVVQGEMFAASMGVFESSK
tara:strand:- start:37 stop:387 length:351 start_codon:yes stop_codon:yes gene_type:complete